MRRLPPLLLLLLILSLGTVGQNRTDQEKEKLQRQVSLLQERLKAAEEGKQGLSSQLEELDLKLQLAQKEENLLQRDFKKAQREREAASRRNQRLADQVEARKKQLKNVLTVLYKRGPLGPLELYLSGNSALSLLQNLGPLQTFSDKLYLSYREYASLLAEKKKQERLLAQKEEAANRLWEDRRRVRAELEQRKGEKDAEMRRLQNEKESFQGLIRETEGQLRRWESLLKAPPSTASPAGASISSLKGRLPWPIRGRVTLKFGIQRHPKYNIRLKSAGIEITPARGEEKVRVVHNGVVIYADYVASYGQTIIVEHPGKYFTLYSHLRDFLVEKGATVSSGEVIGLVGSSGFQGKETLFFSVRQASTPEDPLQWLGSREEARQ